MSTEIRPLPPSLAKIAIDELNELPERIRSDIDCIREWIQKQPHLKARTSDQFLVAFLRGNKYSLEKTKSKIDKYYTLMTAMPELFNNRNLDDPKLLEIIRLGVGVKLLQTDGEAGPRISLIRPGIYDPQRYTFLDILKVGTMIGEIALLEDDNAIVSGHIEILDLANVTGGHLFQLEPILMKKLTIFGQEATPLRHKGFHIINAPSGAEIIFNMFKGFMNEKNRNRFFLHGKNLDSFYEYVPKRLLPIEYGGESDSIQNVINYWENKLLSYKDYFNEDKLYGTDESLRQGPPINEETLFGIDGSFRKLDVD